MNEREAEKTELLQKIELNTRKTKNRLNLVILLLFILPILIPIFISLFIFGIVEGVSEATNIPPSLLF